MINKRVFGSPIPINVQKKLEARQLVARGGKDPEDSIQTRYPDEYDEVDNGAFYYYDDLIASNFEMQGDLSSRTPFARMWTAVAVSDYYDESFAAYNGEKILINSDGKAHFHPNDDEKEGEVILYGPKSTKTMFFK